MPLVVQNDALDFVFKESPSLDRLVSAVRDRSVSGGEYEVCDGHLIRWSYSVEPHNMCEPESKLTIACKDLSGKDVASFSLYDLGMSSDVELMHRVRYPECPFRGIHFFDHIELLVSDIASRLKDGFDGPIPRRMFLETGQKSVIRCCLLAGWQVADSHKELLRRIDLGDSDILFPFALRNMEGEFNDYYIFREQQSQLSINKRASKSKLRLRFERSL